MDMALKYIIVDDRGCEIPILFNNIIDHERVAKGFFKVLEAGFVYLDVDGDRIKASCYGKSTTLDLACRPEDSGLIERTVNH